MGCYVRVGRDIEAWGDNDWNAIREGEWEEGGKNERNECERVRHYSFEDGGRWYPMDGTIWWSGDFFMRKNTRQDRVRGSTGHILVSSLWAGAEVWKDACASCIQPGQEARCLSWLLPLCMLKGREIKTFATAAIR